VVAEATNTVASGLRNVVAGGGLQNIISMFTGSGQQANHVATDLIPNVSSNLIIKTTARKTMVFRRRRPDTAAKKWRRGPDGPDQRLHEIICFKKIVIAR
jgi:hypothetical protein